MRVFRERKRKKYICIYEMIQQQRNDYINRGEKKELEQSPWEVSRGGIHCTDGGIQYVPDHLRRFPRNSTL